MLHTEELWSAPRAPRRVSLPIAESCHCRQQSVHYVVKRNPGYKCSQPLQIAQIKMIWQTRVFCLVSRLRNIETKLNECCWAAVETEHRHNRGIQKFIRSIDNDDRYCRSSPSLTIFFKKKSEFKIIRRNRMQEDWMSRRKYVMTQLWNLLPAVIVVVANSFCFKRHWTN